MAGGRCGVSAQIPGPIVRQGHDASLDYHEWVPQRRVGADTLGRINSRTWTNATKWVCNNGDCPAWAVVRDSEVSWWIEDQPGGELP